MRRFRTAAVTALLLVPIVAGGFLLQAPPARANARLLDQVLSLVANDYVDTLQASALYEKAAKGLVRELNDPYSELFTPRETEDFNRGTGGRYGGTGMYLEEQEGHVVVVNRVFPNTPAEEAGVEAGDRIVGIDGKPTTNWAIDRISEALRGLPGTQVTVTYQRAGVAEPITLKFTRRVVHVPAVLYAAIISDGVGYIPLQTFNENTADEVESAVTKLEHDGAKSIVLDMRDNGGGIVDQALAVSSLFLDEGQEIVSVRSRAGAATPIEVQRATGHHLATRIPLAVLVDEGSASATEIVAGALQDHDRAVLVGETTFGKGLVQSVFPLDEGYALKLTTGKWFTPSGRSIHRDRKFVDGQFVADSAAADSAAKAPRPLFHSDAGRNEYGGGGITPDVVVDADTLSALEQDFYRSIAPKAQIVQTVLSRYALELRPTVKSPDFVAPANWAPTLVDRLRAAGVTIEPRFAAVAEPVLERELEHRVARAAFGDAAAKRRELARDKQLVEAIRLVKGRASQQDVFAAAKSRTSISER